MRNSMILADQWALITTTPDAVPEGVRGTLTDLSVPGCVHTDLLDRNLIADPYLDLNELELSWIGRANWQYSRTIECTPEPETRYELAFDGLDTICEVTFNGTVILSSANMHRRYRSDVTELIRTGDNELVVRFDSAYDAAEAVRLAVGDRPNVYPEPFQYIRKMACNFGWDWGPTLVTAGMWKDVRLESWTTARIESVRPEVSVASTGGKIRAHVKIHRAPGNTESIPVILNCAGIEATATVAADSNSAIVELDDLEVELWWPHDMGTQPRYDLLVTLGTGAVALDTWTQKVGFRTIEHRVVPDSDGTSFVIAINGIDVFIRGVNWIPDDCFISRVDRDRYERRLRQTVGSNNNLVRIWGGGIYEKDEFYDVCDAIGLMVWQDFPFACSAYPEDEPIYSEVAAEAEDNVERLMPHTSLVLWNGNNENIWGFADWNWAEPLEGRSWGMGYYTELLPKIVADVDPTRAYWPGSPYSGSDEHHPNDPGHGNMHSWEVWNRQDYTAYRDDQPRFVSEFGFSGPANWATITRSLSDNPILPDSPGMLHHQKADDGNGKFDRGMAPHLPRVDVGLDTGDDVQLMENWHYLTQLNQARAVEFGISYFRSLRPRCMGTILWQINDCWPVSSWAAVDGDERLKPLWYAMRRAYAPVFLTAQDVKGVLTAIIVNDSTQPISGVLALQRRGLNGDVLAVQEESINVKPGSQCSIPIQETVRTPGSSTRELIVAGIGADACDALSLHPYEGDRVPRVVHCFAEDRAMEFPPARFEVLASSTVHGVVLEVTATTILRHLAVQADRIDPDAIVADHGMTILPGESLGIAVQTSMSSDDPRWSARPVLRCVNDSLHYR